MKENKEDTPQTPEWRQINTVDQINTIIPGLMLSQQQKVLSLISQAHQAGRDEEREKLLQMIGHLPYVSQEEYTKYKNGGIIKWVTLKEHFELLQDNK